MRYHFLNNNTVGNCYSNCKSKKYTQGGCANNVHFFFGLYNNLCACLCDNINKNHISEISKCNLSCGTSINDGECGGLGYFSLYETIHVTLPETHFGGFCLTCRQQSNPNEPQFYSKDCNDKATGHCVMRNGSVSLSTTTTFSTYWKQCIKNNLYIVGDIRQLFCQKESNIWTGLRKYKIDILETSNDSCFIIKINQNIVIYEKIKCSQNHYFLCKQENGHINAPSIEYINTLKSTALPPVTHQTPWTTKTYSFNKPSSFSVTSLKTSSIEGTSPFVVNTISPSLSMPSKTEGNTAAVVGACIAGIAALISFGVFLICVLKRGTLQCEQSKQQAKIGKVFNNTTYDDLVVTNQKQDVTYANTTLENDNHRSICKIDDIYVEKEEDYDHLRTNRQKKATVQADDDRYGSASYFEDNSYSSLRQNRNVDHDLDNEYSVNSMPYAENQSGAVKSPEYDYCYQTNQKKIGN